MNNVFFVLHTKESPWGDYGDILLCGMPVFSNSNTILLERAGPFIPLLYKSLDIVLVKQSIKEMLEKDFPHLKFIPVVKSKIVYIDWVNWDFNSDEPLFYPDTGEPEDYIFLGEHNERISHEMGEIWGIHIPISAGEIYPPKYYTSHNLDDTIIYDICRAENSLHIIVSQQFKNWIEKNCGEWVYFTQLETIAI